MEKQVKEILKSFFQKYKVPDEAIDGAMKSIVQLLNNPVKNRFGASVMTPGASEAWDQGDMKNAKPEII